MHPGKLALVLSTENITVRPSNSPSCSHLISHARRADTGLPVLQHNLYLGNHRPMLVPACIFRVGGAAILLSNRFQDRRRAKCASYSAQPLPAAALHLSPGSHQQALAQSTHRAVWLGRYQLKHFVRSNAAADDEAYRCIYQVWACWLCC